MKAIVQNDYGSPDVLELKEIDKPEVQENEVLVRVQAAALNAGDVLGMRGIPYVSRLSLGVPRPKNWVPGFDVAGHVEAVGSNVTRLHPGDAVFGACDDACAEYACTAEENLLPMPTNLTPEQAAAVPTAAVTALRGLRDVGEVQPGQKVLINGASGGVGTFAVQIAKALGAEVTGVCSTRNVEMVCSIGADHVIDYSKEDFTQGQERYDLILDNVANHSLAECRRVLTPDGVHIPNSSNGGIGFIISAFAQSAFVSQQGRPYFAVPTNQDLADLKEMIEAGKVTPVVDRTYLLSETPDAFRYMEDEHAQGKVVITINGNRGP